MLLRLLQPQVGRGGHVAVVAVQQALYLLNGSSAGMASTTDTCTLPAVLPHAHKHCCITHCLRLCDSHSFGWLHVCCCLSCIVTYIAFVPAPPEAELLVCWLVTCVSVAAVPSLKIAWAASITIAAGNSAAPDIVDIAQNQRLHEHAACMHVAVGVYYPALYSLVVTQLPRGNDDVAGLCLRITTCVSVSTVVGVHLLVML